MGYVGNQQTEGYSQVPAKQDLTGATGTSLTLTHAVASAEGIDLFINNVRQEPTTAYSVGADGVTVTLTGSVVATDDIYVVYNSLARQTSTHPSNQSLQAVDGDFSGDVTAVAGTFSGALTAASATVTGDLTVDTDTLYVDSTNNRVGVNTTSPVLGFNVDTGDMVLSRTTNGDGNELGEFMFWNRTNAGSGTGTSFVNDVASMQGKMVGTGNNSGGSLHFYTKPDGGSKAERVQINGSGNVLFQNNISSSGSYGSYFSPQSSDRDALFMQTSTTAQIGHIHFYNPNGLVGYIASNGSSTNYIVSSDYRLKTNVNYDWDATTRLKQLKPARFEWIADGDDAVPVDGFLAHEVQDIVPEAITGTKDAMRDEEYEVTPAVLDEDGNEVTPAVMGTRSVPDYQGIDQSKLVPLLVKTIQELEARIAALEAN